MPKASRSSRRAAAAPPPRTPPDLAPLWIALAAFLAYSNSFTHPFLFDDIPRIVRNGLIRDLWPPWTALTHTSRPVVQLSFALNHAISGFQVWSWHLVNVALHALAGIVLFALVRRTLAHAEACARYREAAHGMALATALIWAVHPLQTEAVTYVVQRSEILASLFYLITLHALARGAAATRPAPWYATAVAACALGMASKPLMVSAPLVALLYDRTFLAGSWRGIPAERRFLHGALFATLVLVPLLLAAAPMDWRYSSGAGAEGVSALAYARTQPEVILRYLSLAVWPSGLTLDYSWPASTSAVSLVLAALAGVAALGALALAVRGSAWGFLVAAFFLILAPTSSFVPLLDLAFEHRMYLALAVVVLCAVLGGWELMRRASVAFAWPPALARTVASGFVAVATLALGAATMQRNTDYRSAMAIWTDTAAKRPDNLRARVNLAYALADAQGFERGLAEMEEVLRRDPRYPWAHLASGYFLLKLGRLDESIPRLRLAARQLPASAEAHYLLGSALSERGVLGEAIDELEQAVRLEPWRAEAENNLGAAHSRRGAWDEAITHYRRALALDPRYVNARFNLAMAYANLGDVERTRVALIETLALAPDHPRARAALAEIEAGAGR